MMLLHGVIFLLVTFESFMLLLKLILIIKCYSGFINLCESYRMLTLISCLFILVENKSYFVT